MKVAQLEQQGTKHDMPREQESSNFLDAALESQLQEALHLFFFSPPLHPAHPPENCWLSDKCRNIIMLMC